MTPTFPCPPGVVFDAPTGINGDYYDMVYYNLWLIRMEGMCRSMCIISQCCTESPKSLIKSDDRKSTVPSRKYTYIPRKEILDIAESMCWVIH